MTSGQTLALVLALLYLSECILWLSRGSTLFSQWLGRGWRVTSGGSAFGSTQGGAAILPLPSPLGESFRSDAIPLFLSPDGVAAEGASLTAFLSFPLTTAAQAENKMIRANGVSFCQCASPRQAQKIATLLNEISQTAPPRRAGVIRAFWRSRFDLKAARDRVKAVRKATRILRILCNAQFATIFSIGALFSVAPSLHQPIFALLILALTLLAVIVGLYLSAARRLFPDAKEERTMNALKMAVCLPISARASDFLTLPAARDFDSVISAVTLMERADAAPFLSRRWREMKYPLAEPAMDAETAKILNWHQSEILVLLEKLGAQIELTASDCAGIVTPEVSCLSYCPRCLSQFTYPNGDCRDCPGITVQPLHAVK